MRVLVTGASGFIGSRTAALLRRLGHEIVSAAGPGSNHHGAIPIDVASELNFEAIERIGGIDVVVNCAGKAHRFGRISEAMLTKVNVDGSANVAHLAKNVGAKRLIQISSVSVYKNSADAEPVSESGELKTHGAYAQSKLRGERVVTDICKASNIELTILRPVSVIGEGDPGNVGRLIRAIDKGRFVWVGNGQNQKSLLYVEDLARAIATTLAIKKLGPIYNVVGGTISVKSLVSEISQHLEKKLPRLKLPGVLAKAGLDASYPLRRFQFIQSRRRPLETWLSNNVFSGDRFRLECGFEPETDVREALKRGVEAYLSSR